VETYQYSGGEIHRLTRLRYAEAEDVESAPNVQSSCDGLLTNPRASGFIPEVGHQFLPWLFPHASSSLVQAVESSRSSGLLLGSRGYSVPGV